MAIQFEQGDDLPAAEAAYRAADQLGHAAAAVSLGVLLEEREDLEGAEQAFRRADQRGDATGAFHLAWLLQEGGDLDGAEQAYRRAELRGHPAAQANLRMMLGDHANGGSPSNGAAPSVVPESEATAPQEPELIEAEPDLADDELEPLAHAPTHTEGLEPLTTSLAAFGPATEELPIEPIEPHTDRDEADVLAAAVAASAVAGRRGPGRRGTERTEGKPRTGGVIARVLAIAIPVAAFAAAFILGAGSRPHKPAPSHLATASGQHGSATVASVATVPAPAKLVVKRHPVKKAKAKPAHTAALAAHSTAASSSPTISRQASTPPPPLPTHSTVTTTQGSGGSSVTSGTGTTSGSG
ncbi:MAG: hypothetical protein WAU75_22145 [Solirubrobacteraceae bacterium]